MVISIRCGWSSSPGRLRMDKLTRVGSPVPLGILEARPSISILPLPIGSPTFYFYPPLTYFLAAGLHVLGFGANGTSLYNPILVLAGLASFGCSWLLLRKVGLHGLYRIVSSLLYAFGPYAYIDAFSRSALSEYLALAWIPLLFLGTMKVLDRERHGALITVFAWSALILTNIPAGICAGLAWTVYIAFSKNRTPRSLLILYCGLAISFGLTAFYWLPAIRFSELIRTGWYHSIISDRVNAVTALLFRAPLSSTIAIGSTAIFLVACIALYLSRRERNSQWMMLLGAVILQLPFLSDLLYTKVFPFTVVQFSWRFGMICMLALSVELASIRTRLKGYLLLALSVISLAFYSAYGFNHIGHKYEPLPTPHIDRDAPEYVSTYVTYADNELYRLLLDEAKKPLIVGDGIQIYSADLSPTMLSATLSSTKPTWIRLHQFYWPTWRVWFGSEQLQIKPDKDGFLTALLPPGTGRLEASIAQSNLERTAGLLSLASLLLFALVQIIILLNAQRRKQ
jgi:hypothetical protein